MSVDIDWPLLSTPSDSGTELASTLVSALNAQLNNASRPSFLGPVTVASFDFGTAAPNVEIKDVRDVWRAFDAADDEGDELARELSHLEQEEEEEYEDYRAASSPNLVMLSASLAHAHPHIHAAGYASSSATPVGLSGYITPRRPARGRHPAAPLVPHIPLPLLDDDADSVYSLGSRSVASVGIGLAALGRRRLLGSPSRPASRAASVRGYDRDASRERGLARRGSGQDPSAHTAALSAALGRSAPPSSPPPSPPARPRGMDDSNANPLPSVQLHLRVEHAADISLVLLTSLQVNYPSALFMALPLKLVISGMTLAADVVMAYSAKKNRVHVTIVDEERTGHEGGTQAIGQRILPALHIESEIGHADAHVLRNVGKVERFIVEVVRKTLVDELVFPNFHTVAL